MMLWLLTACGLFIGSDDVLGAVDRDGDGYQSPEFGGEDCDDNDPDVHPDADDPPYDGIDADCAGDDDFDADLDGLAAEAFGGADCDDTDPLVQDDPAFFYADCDGDGVPGDQGLFACTAPAPPLDPSIDPCEGATSATFVSERPAVFDCDDSNPSVRPPADGVPVDDELYDGVDSDCSGGNDFDADGDGYVAAGVVGAVPSDEAPGVGDCDDADPDVHPGAADTLYDGIDSDCDGANDFDADGDAFVDAAYPEQVGGTAPFSGDCDDASDAVFPGAPDTPYDDVDSNCDGANDFDADLDGAVADEHADEAAGLAVGDCDDLDPLRSPLRDELYYDGVDGDCDGANDFDADGDGVVSSAFPGASGGTAPAEGDCDDAEATTFPGADDPRYDGVDSDCDGSDDYDADGDGYLAGLPDLPATLADCDDTDPLVHPGADDAAYDGVDSDCDGANDYDADSDGAVDDAWAAVAGLPGGDCDDADPTRSPLRTEVWYDGIDTDCGADNDYDRDGDGVVAAAHAGREGGTAPLGGDCDDGDAAIAPGLSDTWYDGIDSDCDGADDYDRDRDGYRADDGFLGLAEIDCDDDDPSVHPGAPDAAYDGIDADCGQAVDPSEDDYDADGDGTVPDLYAALSPLPAGDCDDTDPLRSPLRAEAWYDGLDGDCLGGNDYDADADGYVAAGFPEAADGDTLAGDCDDGDALVNPSRPEAWYDGVDADCDGRNDYDRDGDGYVDSAHPGTAGGTAPFEGDCNDLSAAVSPGANDAPYDGLSTDCDDANDYDADGDGFVDAAYPEQIGGTAPFPGDCDDGDPAVFPGAPDAWYDGLDADCAGDSDYDADADGYVPSSYEGFATAGQQTGDCDDGNPLVNPGAVEVYYDGLDADCDGANDHDADGDGYVATGSEAFVGGSAPQTGDCRDDDPGTFPGAADTPYDGVDADCAGDDDYDVDGDGFPLGPDCVAVDCDCDDADPTSTWGEASFDDSVDLVTVLGEACDGAELTLQAGTYPVDALDLARSVTLRGEGATTVLQASGTQAVLATAGLAALHDLRLTGGSGDDGGCLVVHGSLTLDGVTLDDCTATGDGGAVYVADGGVLTMLDSTVTTSSATNGGGIAVAPGGELVAIASTVDGTTASPGSGGGIWADGAELDLDDVQLTGGYAATSGGGLYAHDATVTLTSLWVDDAVAEAHGGAVLLDGAGGLVDGLSATDCFANEPITVIGADPLPGIVELNYAGRAYPLLDVHDIDVSGGDAGCGLSVHEPQTLTTVDDVVVHAPTTYGINLETQLTDAQVAILEARHLLVTEASTGLRMDTFGEQMSIEVHNATLLGQYTGLSGFVFASSGRASNILATATNGFGIGVSWTDLGVNGNGGTDLSYAYVLDGASFTRWYSGGTYYDHDDPPPFCDSCGGVANRPLDADYQLSGPLSGKGDPTQCGPSDPPSCLDPGYWGGPGAPTP